MRPVRNLVDQPVFDRIEVNVVHMALQVAGVYYFADFDNNYGILALEAAGIPCERIGVSAEPK